MMFISEIHQEYLALAAGLLSDQFKVSIQYIFPEGDNEPKVDNGVSLREEILSRIPCKADSKIKDSLEVVNLNMSASNSSMQGGDCKLTANEPFDRCTIKKAPEMISAFQSYTTHSEYFTSHSPGERPDIFVMDTTLVAGLLLSEKLQIPTVAIGTHNAFDLTIEHDPHWSPNTNWQLPYRLYRVVRQRLYSLSLTRSFIELNRLRRRTGLRPLTNPMDYFLPVVTILVEYSSKTIGTFDNQDYWRRVYITGAIQPPCFPCTPASKSSSKRKRPRKIVMISLPHPGTAEDIRSILRGLILARSLIEEYDECEWDPLSCRNEATEFQIVWLDFGNNMDFFPEILPNFVTRELSLGLLDSLTRHPNTISVLAHCDSNTRVASMLGVSVICVTQSSRLPNVSLLLNQTGTVEHRDVARKLISVLRRHTVDHDSSTVDDSVRLDGLSRAIALLRLVGKSQRSNRPWDSTRHMQQALSQVVTDSLCPVVVSSKHHQGEMEFLEDDLPYDSFTVLVAWIVVLSSGMYVLLDSVFTTWRPRRSHYRSDNPSDGILTRLPDLDDAWEALIDWYSNQPSLLEINEASSEQRNRSLKSNHRSSHNSGHHHPSTVRRRKRR
jgi:hypothetical protein